MKLMSDMPSAKLTDYRSCFDSLRAIVYRDIHINGSCFKLLAVNLLDYGPDYCIKKHRHSFFEACYITENNTYTTINEKEYLLKPGQFYILPPGTFHSHRQDPGTSHVGFGLRWEVVKGNEKGMDLSNTFRGTERIYDRLLNIPSCPVTDSSCTVLDAMLALLNMAGKRRGTLELQMEVFQLILLLCDFYDIRTDDYDIEINSACIENGIIELAAGFIEENYFQDINAGDVAQFVHLSYSQLYRLFRKQFGDTVTGYLFKVRMRKAQQLLVCTDKGIGSISRETGFGSESHFCRSFKKFCGVPPKVFRRNKGQLSE